MGRFVKKIGSFLLLIAVLFAAMRFYVISNRPKNYNSAFIDKLRLLQQNKNNRKIILLGGSSVGFGLSAQMIEQQTGIKTINLGHQAGFGLTDFQSFVLNNLTKNDIIVFSPEWEFYADPTFEDKAILDNLIQNNLSYAFIIHKPLYLFDALFTSVASTDFVKISADSLAREGRKDMPYVYNCLNTNGDIVSHCGLTPRGPKAYTLHNRVFDVQKFTSIFPFIRQYKTILLFPPTQQNVYRSNKADLDDIEQKLAVKGITTMDRVEDNVYADSSFFDFEYHLRCQDRAIRTQKVIDYLKRHTLLK